VPQPVTAGGSAEIEGSPNPAFPVTAAARKALHKEAVTKLTDSELNDTEGTLISGAFCFFRVESRRTREFV
jgi:hypothetical protein